MERAVQAVGERVERMLIDNCADLFSPATRQWVAWMATTSTVVAIGALRTSDPDAFAAVLAECGLKRATVHKGGSAVPHICELSACEEVWRG